MSNPSESLYQYLNVDLSKLLRMLENEVMLYPQFAFLRDIAFVLWYRLINRGKRNITLPQPLPAKTEKSNLFIIVFLHTIYYKLQKDATLCDRLIKANQRDELEVIRIIRNYLEAQSGFWDPHVDNNLVATIIVRVGVEKFCDG